MNYKVDIGGLVYKIYTEVPSLSKYIARSFAQFSTHAKPDYHIHILVSRRTSDNYSVRCTNNREFVYEVPFFMRSYRRFHFSLKTIVATTMLYHGGLILHASAIEYDKNGYVFAGKEGSGKSTIITLIPDCTILNDDFAILRPAGRGYVIYSSPFREKNPFPKGKKRAILKKIFILEQAKKTNTLAISRQSAIMKLLPLVLSPLSFIPKEWRGFSPSYCKDIGERAFNAIERLSLHMPTAVLQFTKDRSVVKILENESQR